MGSTFVLRVRSTKARWAPQGTWQAIVRVLSIPSYVCPSKPFLATGLFLGLGNISVLGLILVGTCDCSNPDREVDSPILSVPFAPALPNRLRARALLNYIMA